MDIKGTLIEHLKKVVNFLDHHKIDYALAGGLAFSALVEPRATIDIDVLSMIKEDELPSLLDQLGKEFESLVPHTEPMQFNFVKIWRAVSFTDEREIITI